MTLANLDWLLGGRGRGLQPPVSSDVGGIMFKNTRLRAVVVLAAGALLGYAAASGNFPLGRQAAAAGTPLAVATQAGNRRR
jgi:hypothetical protein